jgi:hypothetical protein
LVSGQAKIAAAAAPEIAAQPLVSGQATAPVG